MMDRRPILIVGAGIGGLTLALELARKGVRACIIERAPALEEVGAGLQLSPNASWILDRLGLGDELDTRGTRPDAVQMLDGRSGRTVATIPLGLAAEQRWGAPYRVIHRAQLQHILYSAALAEGIQIQTGTELVDYADTASGILAHIRGVEGDETFSAPAMIGADGLHSTLRARLVADDARFSGQVAWRATIRLESRNETGLWLGPGAHLVTYRLNGEGDLNLVAVTGGAAEGRGWSNPGSSGEIREAFRRWSPVVQELISAPAKWMKWPLFDRDPSLVWGKGRATLLGDAAHPMLPHLAQGAAMAIEDASLLAARLAQNPDHPDRAFRSYEAVRQPRTAAVALMARRNGRIYRLPAPASFARDSTLRFLGTERLIKRLDWLYGHRDA
ncbi:FAD-dependent monooxygenase [Terrihabitans sp. B22-R8]|uniref:FAD-dependent monooxygenase n=1 Tax=Terrihabitans sp. B22-R8 TaxID=3425128 RepID=UPI00403C45E9